MTHKPGTLYAARFLNDKDCQWWALPQVLNHHKATPREFAHCHLVGKHPHLLYLLLTIWTKTQLPSRSGEKAMQKGRHFWHRLTKKQRTQPLERELGQRMVRAFGCPDKDLTQIVNTEKVSSAYYLDNGVVKAIQQGSFSYGCRDGESELEYWTTVSCGGCSNKETIREQLGGDTPAQFLASYGEQLEGLEHKTGPYCYCPRCDQVTRVTVEQATELPPSGWENVAEDSGDDWPDFEEHLEGLIQDMLGHLKAKGFPDPSGLYVSGDNLDWRGRSGWTTCKLEGEDFASKLKVNSDFTISNGRLMLHQDGGGELRCVLSHHDVPMGGVISAMPYWECELNENEHLNFEQLGQAACLAEVADVMVTGHHELFRFGVSGTPFKLVARDSLVEVLTDMQIQCGLDEDRDTMEPEALAMALIFDNLIGRIQQGQVEPTLAKQTRRVLDAWIEKAEERE